MHDVASHHLFGRPLLHSLRLAVALAQEHQDDNTVVGYAQKVVREATDFVKQRNLVSVPAVPLEVIAMPEFNRGVAIAYCDSAGPLENR